MKRLSFIKIILPLAALVLLVWWSGFFDSETSPTNTVYRVEPASTGVITRSVSASGSVEPLITVEIGSQLSGQVKALYADYNDEVKAGQLLAQIDPQTFETNVKQANAQLAVAKANVAMQEASITRAEAQLEEAEREVKRQRELRRQNTIAQSTLDTAITSFKSAQADLSSAQASLKNAMATVDQRQAALDQANIDLARTEIRSSINGTVIERSVDVGQTVAASLSAPKLFQLAQDLSEIQVEAAVDEADIGAVAAGNRVEFNVDAYPDRTYAGEVKQIRLAPDDTSNVVTYTVIITAHNENRTLLPGMTANVEIFTGEKSNVVRIDNDALRYRPSDSATRAEAPARPRDTPSAVTAKLVEALGLSDTQTTQILEAMMANRPQPTTQENSSSRGLAMGPPPPGSEERTRDRVAMRQKMEEARDKVMRAVLTPEQWANYQAYKKAQSDVRFTTVWQLMSDNTLQGVNVTLGLSDDNFTEVVEGLSAGDRIVIREERPKQ